MTTTPIMVYAEATPNPSAMKYVCNRIITKDEKKVEYLNKESAKGSPLALELFQFNAIESLFFADNYVTIQKKDGFIWGELHTIFRAFLKGFLEEGKPTILVYPEDVKEAIVYTEDEVELKIIEILDTYIKPAVEQDGGAIIFRHFDKESGTVTVAMQGSCSGCPSSQVTLKSGIERLLKNMVPSVQEVVAEEI